MWGFGRRTWACVTQLLPLPGPRGAAARREPTSPSFSVLSGQAGDDVVSSVIGLVSVSF